MGRYSPGNGTNPYICKANKAKPPAYVLEVVPRGSSPSWQGHQREAVLREFGIGFSIDVNAGKGGHSQSSQWWCLVPVLKHSYPGGSHPLPPGPHRLKELTADTIHWCAMSYTSSCKA